MTKTQMLTPMNCRHMDHPHPPTYRRARSPSLLELCVGVEPTSKRFRSSEYRVSYKIPLTKRQRRSLGLPQPRPGLPLPMERTENAGKTVISGVKTRRGGLSVHADMKAKWWLLTWG